MKKSRILASIILTAGIGLSGVAVASASGTTQPEHHKGRTAVCVIVQKGKDGKSEKTTVKVIDDKIYINGKQAPKSKLPGKCDKLPPLPEPGKGKHVCVIVHKDSKGAPAPGKPEQTGAKVVDKQVAKGKLPAKCPIVPPPPGKGKHVCVIVVHKDDKGTAVPEKSDVKVVNGKVSVNGKQAPKDKLPGKCPAKPPLPGKDRGTGKGIGGVTFDGVKEIVRHVV